MFYLPDSDAQRSRFDVGVGGGLAGWLVERREGEETEKKNRKNKPTPKITEAPRGVVSSA
jgi:hypothetical protein